MVLSIDFKDFYYTKINQTWYSKFNWYGFKWVLIANTKPDMSLKQGKFVNKNVSQGCQVVNEVRRS